METSPFCSCTAGSRETSQKRDNRRPEPSRAARWRRFLRTRSCRGLRSKVNRGLARINTGTTSCYSCPRAQTSLVNYCQTRRELAAEPHAARVAESVTLMPLHTPPPPPPTTHSHRPPNTLSCGNKPAETHDAAFLQEERRKSGSSSRSSVVFIFVGCHRDKGRWGWGRGGGGGCIFPD